MHFYNFVSDNRYDSQSHPQKPNRLKSKKDQRKSIRILQDMFLKDQKIQNLRDNIKSMSDTSSIKRILAEVQQLARSINLFELIFNTTKIRADFLLTLGM